MSRSFASRTSVPVSKTRVELEEMLTKAKASAVAVFTSEGQAAVAFEMQGRRILFKIALQKGNAPRDEQKRKERWRALLLTIKAKLVSFESGIETFEDAFMAHVVMPDGGTVSDHVRPRIADAYKNQHMVPLLPGPTTKQ